MRRRLVCAAAMAAILTACAQQRPPVEDPVGFDQPASPLPSAGATTTAPQSGPSPTSPTSGASPTSPTSAASRAASTRAPYPVVLAWDGIEVHAASARTAMIGLHQSNHDGARDLDVVDGSAVPTVVMASRERGTGRRGAADVVVHADTELRAPVTGTVKRAGTYTLYCDEMDDFLVIEPDGRPGIEVKLLHLDGVQVAAGDRVVAGDTVVAPRPTPLPFESQVDELSGPEDWPHVHLEVVDTSIPDQPNENSGSDDC